MIICPQCDTPNREGDKFCEQCGAPLQGADEDGSGSTMVAAGPAGAARLVRVGGNGQGMFELGTRAVVGRLDSCDLPINDRSVSREHARLSRLRDGYVLEDLGSTNGTLVNGKRIDEAVLLHPGDVVTFGSIEFRYETDRDQQAPFAADAETGSPTQEDRQQAEPEFDEAREGTRGAAELPPVPVSFPPLEPFPLGDVQQVAETAPEPASETGPSAPVDKLVTVAGEPDEAAEAPGITAHGTGELALATVETARTLSNLLEDLARQIEEDRRARSDLEERLTTLEARDRAREMASQMLADVPLRALTREQVGSLQDLLEALNQNPRDVEILMRLGQHAAQLSALVEESSELRHVVERANDAISRVP